MIALAAVLALPVSEREATYQRTRTWLRDEFERLVREARSLGHEALRVGAYGDRRDATISARLEAGRQQHTEARDAYERAAMASHALAILTGRYDGRLPWGDDWRAPYVALRVATTGEVRTAREVVLPRARTAQEQAARQRLGAELHTIIGSGRQRDHVVVAVDLEAGVAVCRLETGRHRAYDCATGRVVSDLAEVSA